MKKTFAIILVLVLGLVLFSACTGDNTEAELDKALDELNKDVPLTATDAIILPTVSNGDISVKWISSDETILTSSGIVYRYLEDKTVDLKSELTLGGKTREKTFTITIPKLEGLTNITDVQTVDVDESHLLFVQVYGFTKDGYYVGNGNDVIYVESNEVPSIIGQNVLLNVRKKLDGNRPYYEELSKKLYLGTSGEVNFGSVPQNLDVFAQKDLNLEENFSTMIYSTGYVKIEDDSIYIDSTSLNTRVKLASNSVDATTDYLKTTLIKDNYVVKFKGFLHKNDGEMWEINITSNDYVEANEMSSIEILGQIVTFVNESIPKYIDKSIEQISLPTTHPLFTDAVISWNLLATEGLINENGVVYRLSDDKSVGVSYIVQYQNYDRTGNITMTIASSLDKVSELLTAEVYNEAKCLDGDIPGETCWNDKGVYVYRKTYNLEGIIVDKGSLFILLKDKDEDLYIPIVGITGNWTFELEKGDKLFFENVYLRTNGYALELYRGEYNPEKSTFGGEVPTLVYETISFDELEQLDNQSIETYLKLYEVEKSFVCYNGTHDYQIVISNIVEDCTENQTNDFTINETAYSSFVSYEARGSNKDGLVTASEVKDIYVKLKVYYRGMRRLIREKTLNSSGDKEVYVDVYKRELFALGYAEKVETTVEEEIEIYKNYLKKSLNSFAKLDGQSGDLRLYEDFLNNNYASYSLTKEMLNIDIKYVSSELTCSEDRFCPNEPYKRITHTPNGGSRIELTPGYVALKYNNEAYAGLFFLSYASDQMKQYIVDPLNNYPESGDDTTGAINLDNPNDGQAFTFDFSLKYEIYIDGIGTGEFIEHSISKEVVARDSQE